MKDCKHGKAEFAYCEECCREINQSVSNSASVGVMPARVEERRDFYYITFDDGGMFSQRKDTFEATESPLTLKEIIINKLCKTILEKQA